MKRKTTLSIVFGLGFCLFILLAVVFKMGFVRKAYQESLSLRWSPYKAESKPLMLSPVEFDLLMKNPALCSKLLQADRPIGPEVLPSFYFAVRQKLSDPLGVDFGFPPELLVFFQHWAALAWGDLDELLQEQLFGSDFASSMLKLTLKFENQLEKGFRAQAGRCSLVEREKAFRWMQSDASQWSAGLQYFKKCAGKKESSPKQEDSLSHQQNAEASLSAFYQQLLEAFFSSDNSVHRGQRKVTSFPLGSRPELCEQYLRSQWLNSPSSE